MDYIKIDERICTGCRECAEVCPCGAIIGKKGEPQTIDTTKCIKCGKCVQKCKGYITDFRSNTTLYNEIKEERHLPKDLREPLFAAYNVCQIEQVIKALKDPNVFTMVQCAPAVRVAIAEEFGHRFGTLSDGKLAAALKALKFDRVYDTNFTADLTIMEEGSELIKRITEGGILPMFTSCCPAWVQYIENNRPKLTDHLSSCKSPQQMMGAVMKTYGAKINNISPEKIFTVSIMPCTAKAFESDRPEMTDSGYKDVDCVLTTRELAYLIKTMGIDFNSLEESSYDEILGEFTGAGTIFGITGGVMEAAIRTGYELITGKPIENIDVEEVRSDHGIRKAEIQCEGTKIRVGVVTGLNDIDYLLDAVEGGFSDLDFIEVMTCPTGCISGGGQPKLLVDTMLDKAYNSRREALLKFDSELPIRKSHENPAIKKIYDDFLEKPLMEKSHHLLHTTYCNGKETN